MLPSGPCARRSSSHSSKTVSPHCHKKRCRLPGNRTLEELQDLGRCYTAAIREAAQGFMRVSAGWRNRQNEIRIPNWKARGRPVPVGMEGRPADRLPKPEARSPAEQAAIGTEAETGRRAAIGCRGDGGRVPLIEGTGGQAGRRHVSKGVPGKIAGPWDIDGIWVIQSGSPISPPFCRAAFPIPAPMSRVAPATGRTVTRTATFPPASPSTVGLTPQPSAFRLPELSATPDRISWLVPASLILTAVSTATS